MKDLINRLLLVLTISVSAVYANECCEQPKECNQCCEQPACCEQPKECSQCDEQPTCCGAQAQCCGAQTQCCAQQNCCESTQCCEKKETCCEQDNCGYRVEPIKGQAAFSGFVNRGNAHSENIEIELKLNQKIMEGCIPIHQWSFRGEYDYDHNRNAKNTNKGRFIGNYEYRFWSPWAVRFEEQISFNLPQDLRLRSDAFASLGYYAIETCDITLELLAGFGHEDSYFRQRPANENPKIDEHDFELDLGWELKWTFVNGWKLWQEFEYAPAMDHFDDYRIYMDNELTIPIYKCWGIGFEYEFTYLSQVPKDKKKFDSTLSVKLTYDF